MSLLNATLERIYKYVGELQKENVFTKIKKKKTNKKQKITFMVFSGLLFLLLIFDCKKKTPINVVEDHPMNIAFFNHQ